MIIRTGEKKDVPAILSLIQELAHFEKEPNAVIITVDDLVRDGFGTTKKFQTFIAEVEHQVVGMALYYYRYSTWKGTTIHLEDLIVREAYRNRGIGNALYHQVISQAHNEGIQRVEWAVLNWNTPAISFYEKSGAHVLPDWRIVQMDQQGIDNFLKQQKKMQ